jgi:hypothetical protein
MKVCRVVVSQLDPSHRRSLLSFLLKNRGKISYMSFQTDAQVKLRCVEVPMLFDSIKGLYDHFEIANSDFCP